MRPGKGLRRDADPASSPDRDPVSRLRYAILADIHSNLEALEAVLAALSKARIDRYVCVGDVVGYGADPKPCIDIVRDTCSITIAGNHDWAVAGTLSLEFFNSYARDAIRWTQERLEQPDLVWLRDLPLEPDLDGLAMPVH